MEMEFEGDIKSGDEGSDSEANDGPETWHFEDDTEEDIPDPNNDVNPLFQDQNHLPKPLRKADFVEGFVYSLTLIKEKSITYLGFLVENKKHTFIFRVYHAKGTSRKTFHKGASDKEWEYNEA